MSAAGARVKAAPRRRRGFGRRLVLIFRIAGGKHILGRAFDDAPLCRRPDPHETRLPHLPRNNVARDSPPR